MHSTKPPSQHGKRIQVEKKSKLQSPSLKRVLITWRMVTPSLRGRDLRVMIYNGTLSADNSFRFTLLSLSPRVIIVQDGCRISNQLREINLIQRKLLTKQNNIMFERNWGYISMLLHSIIIGSCETYLWHSISKVTLRVDSWKREILAVNVFRRNNFMFEMMRGRLLQTNSIIIGSYKTHSQWQLLA